MRSLNYVLSVIMLSGLAASPTTAQSLKPSAKVIVDDFAPEYESVDALSEASGAVARVRIRESKMRRFDVPNVKRPSALMEHTADVLEVLKGTLPGKDIMTFYQRAGSMDLGGHKITYQASDDEIPKANDEVVVFLRWNRGLQVYELVSTNAGLYRVKDGVVAPLGRGKLADRYRSGSAAAFLQDLRTATRGR